MFLNPAFCVAAGRTNQEDPWKKCDVRQPGTIEGTQLKLETSVKFLYISNPLNKT